MAGWLNALKDTAITATVRQIIALRIKPYGELRGFQIDTAARRIDLSILLNGEPGAVDLTVLGYQILEKEGVTSLHIPARAFTSSRTWLAQLLNAEVAGKSFKIPAKYAASARSLVD